ncbi:MAG: OTU domain-containing protein [Legionellales bacterium]|jgi:hypothetical protein
MTPHENRARRDKAKQHYDSLGILKITPWQTGFEEGRGILQNGIANSMMKNLKTKAHTGTVEQNTFYEIIYSFEDLKRVSQLGTEAVLPYGALSIKAMIEYSQELHLESNYIYCIMGTTYLSSSERKYQQGNLTQEKLRKFKTGDLQDFEEIDGAHFVSGHVKGAIFLGRAIIKMQSVEDARAIRAELGAQSLFQLLSAGFKGNSQSEKRLSRGSIDFNAMVQGLNSFECSPKSIADMQAVHSRFDREIINHPEKLDSILAFCEPIESALPFVFNFTQEGLSNFKTALKKNIDDLTQRSIGLGSQHEKCVYEDFFTIAKKTRTFFELDPFIEIEVGDLPEQTEAKVETRNVQQPYEKSEIVNGTYSGHFIPQWGAGLYESIVKVKFSGPRKNHPDTVHTQAIIATQIKWLQRLQTIVTNNAYVGISIEKISLYLAMIILKMMSSKDASKLYGLEPDSQPLDDTGNSLFTAIAKALNKINSDTENVQDSNNAHDTAASIRSTVVKFMSQNGELKEHISKILERDNTLSKSSKDKQQYASVEDYLQDMARANVPATHIELAALPYSLARPVVLITPGNAYDKMLIHEDFANNTPLFIKFTNGYYQALHVPAGANPRDILCKIRDAEFEREHTRINNASCSSSASHAMDLNSDSAQTHSNQTMESNNNSSQHTSNDTNKNRSQFNI